MIIIHVLLSLLFYNKILLLLNNERLIFNKIISPFKKKLKTPFL